MTITTAPRLPHLLRHLFGGSRFASILAIAFCALGAWATQANAGTATVYQCLGPHKEQAALDMVSSTGHGGVVAVDAGCGDGSGYTVVSTGPAGTRVNADFERELSFRAPAGTSIVGGEINRQMWNYRYNGSGQSPESWGFGYSLLDSNRQLREMCGQSIEGSHDCSLQSDGRFRFSSGSFKLPTQNVSSYILRVGCTIDSGTPGGYCAHVYDFPGLVNVSGRFMLADNGVPDVRAVSGALASADPVRIGDEALTLEVDDEELGVYRERLLVDGVETAVRVIGSGSACRDADPSNDNPYEFLAAVPCAKRAQASIDFGSGLLEGRHRIVVEVEDAAGNTAVALNRTVTIDRVAAPVSVSVPTVSGTTQDGRTLRGEAGSWNGQGLQPTYTYRWLRCGQDGTGCVPTGKTDETYDLGPEDAFHTLVFEVTATTSEGSTVALSAPTSVVKDRNGVVVVPGIALAATDVRCAGAAIQLEDLGGAKSRRFGTSGFDLRGKLVAPGGAPVGGQAVEVTQAISRRGTKTLTTVTTGADGTFTAKVPTGPSRTLRATTRTCDVASAAVSQSVRGQVRLKAGTKVVANTGLARFTGQLRGGYIGKGVNLVLQGLKPGTKQWVDLKPLRSNAKGRFKSSWRFRPARAYRYSFRVVVRDSGWPYAAGSPSSAVRVATRSR